MPTYKITSPDGRTVELTGDSPPSEVELTQIFAGIPKASAEAPKQEVSAPSIMDTPAGRFAGAAWEQVNPVNIVKGLGQAALHPIDTIQAAGSAMGSEWEKAGQAWDEGRYSEAVGHGAAGSIPLVGPAAAAAGERIGSGDVAGGLGAGAGLVGSMLLPRAVGKGVKAAVPVLNKIRAPFAGNVDPAMVAAAARTGVEMPASALSTSRVVPLAETVSAKGLGGSGTAARYTGAVSALTSRAEQLVARASKYATESERGIAVANGYKAYRQHWIQTKNALYKDAAIPDGASTVAADTVKLLDEVIANKQGAARVTGAAGELGFFEKLREGLASGPVSLKDMRGAIQEINAKIGGAHADAWSAANKQLLKKVAATLDGEFVRGLDTAAPQVAAKLKVANAAYAEGLGKINSTFGKSINKLAQAGKWDDIAKAVANSRMSVDDVPRLFEVVGPQGTQAVRASVLADVVSKAKNSAGQLTPEGLARAIKRFDDNAPGSLNALLTPEQLTKLDDLSKLSSSLAKGTRIMEGSQTAPLLRAGGIVAAAPVAPLGALKMLLGDLAFNKFISTKAGQRWLTRGFDPWTAPTVDTAASRVGSTVASSVPNAMQPAPATR